MRLIDADYLKDVLLLHNYHGNNKDIVPYSDRKGYRLRQREVEEAIINAPTILEREKGEWIKDERHSVSVEIYLCSICKRLGNPYYKYCPHCGAGMKGDYK